MDEAFNERDLVWDNRDEIEDRFKKVIELIKELLNQSPKDINLCKTRLKNQANFYSFFGAISELNSENYLKITSDICNRIDIFLKSVDSPEARINLPEAQDYYDAITTSVSSGIEKNKTRINILKSVILGTINLSLTGKL